MNKTFLEYVAEDIIGKYGTDLSRIAVVFPNKRAALFLNEHLARIAGQPVWSPAYITISDLFRQHTDLKPADPIKLICDIHKSFTKCTGIDETLDHFYGWGQLLLADFDDIDKNMADADSIFCNLKDIHELDDISYLDDEQKEMLKRFFANFSDDIESELKKRFLSLWSHFGDIYHDYNRRLTEQGIGYEGAIYRKVASEETLHLKYDKYLFVGFNLIQKVERVLFSRLMKEGKAKFYWDFDEYYMPTARAQQSASVPNNTASFAAYLTDFPNELDNTDRNIYANMRRPKRIRFISSPTENAQARFASNWLLENDRYKAGRKTAVVMCDESILLPIMHSLPPEADKVNITSGFPLAMTPVASLVMLLFDLYTLGLRKKGTAFNPHYLKKLMAHPYARHLQEVHLKGVHLSQVHQKEEQQTIGDNSGCMGMAGMPYPPTSAALLQHIATLVKQVGIATKQEGDALTQESVFRMFTILNRLAALADSGDLVVDNTTLRRLVSQLVGAASIPFHGEPVVGVQIMGVLETRNIDFDNVLLLSCNEGNMPKGVNDSSFIPYSIRKAHGLTTIDNKVAIYSYYFHRLLQRAGDITIAYNNSTDNGHTGEMSRFMLQLLVESGQKIDHYSLTAKNQPTPLMPKAIEKDEAAIDKLEEMSKLSPSAINTYIRCKLAFYYQYIAHIKEPDSDPETIDNRMFGNIFHRAAYLIYKDITDHSPVIEKAHIQAYLSNRKLLASVVDRAFEEEECKTNNGLQIINREVIIEYITKLLKIDQQLCPFSILAMEEEAKVYTQLSFTIPSGGALKGGALVSSAPTKQYDLTIGGIIDRLDAVTDKQTGKRRIRVVDYKTGNKPSSAIKSIEEVFDPKNIASKHSNYFLQAILYSLIVSRSKEWNAANDAVSPALLFIKQAATNGYDPTLCIDKHPISDVTVYEEEFLTKLKETVADMYSPDAAFTPTDDRKKCELCPYRMLCGL
ncbi:PD-(D/E)XK nuclease family protein [Prevotella stercorea]|uniref:PD-(D/E)XK nuclease family protein n=1 Tax=Leyella stercorea TaxID=363265 RepID=UPI001C2B8B07|nr:PD-(D/E)XK nuclease family protein [Leyella stercorea]MBU9898424.1 PD-(D/E)XK nuclease family protein [Leyella stercorea]MBU9946199.1 PD-(D/E)XK nuclease family protein [Leyella stercorea]